MPGLLVAIGLVAAVLMVASLASGLVRRSPISFPMIFLGLGFLLGQNAMGVLHVDAHSQSLEIVATISLSFVLFLDALSLRFEEFGRDWVVPVLALGPGTLLTVAFVAGAAYLLLGTPLVHSLLLGAILASVDPVLLRDVVGDERIPRSIRRALQTEAGTNDIVVLPIILVLEAVALGTIAGVAGWAELLGRLFILGPVIGVIVGVVATRLIEAVERRTEVSRAYRALYGVGTILAAYVAGEGVGASGFLAVFAAGAAVASLDYDLCDCFLEYGETTSEMAMLLAFTLFGALLSSTIGTVPLLPALGLAFITLVVARPIAIGLVLRGVAISSRARFFIGWFGPRGLSSLLFGLLLVLNGVPGAEGLLALAGVVVIISVIAHGLSAAPLAARYDRAVAHATLAEEREGTASGLFRKPATEVPRITPRQLAERLNGDDPPLVLDVRTRSSYEQDPAQIPGSVRVPPEQVGDWGQSHPRERSVVTYCT